MSEKQYDTLARKYIGEDHQAMTPQEQLRYLVNPPGFDTAMREVLDAGIDKLSYDQAREEAYSLMKLNEAANNDSPSMAELLRNLRAKMRERQELSDKTK